MRNHEISAFSGPPVTQFSTIFAPLTAPRSAPKTIASAERANKRPLPTDHNANLHQKFKLEECPVMILMLSVSIRLTILKPTSHTYPQDISHAWPFLSSCKSPISYCMLPFADMQLNAEHELKGGGVPSPKGLQ